MLKLDNNISALIEYSIERLEKILENHNKYKICSVSAIFGKSDQIDFLNNNFQNIDQYIFVFTDDYSMASMRFSNPKFKVIFIPKELTLDNPRLTAKIFKVFIPIIFNKFFYSALWLDANLMVSDFKKLLQFVESKSRKNDTLILFNHRKKSRHIIRELLQVFILRKDSFLNLLKVLFYLLKHLHKRDKLNILFKRIFWGGFIYFKKLDQKISYYWWEFIKLSIRDQLSLPLIALDNNYSSLNLSEVKEYILSVEHLTYKHYHKSFFR